MHLIRLFSLRGEKATSSHGEHFAFRFVGSCAQFIYLLLTGCLKVAQKSRFVKPHQPRYPSLSVSSKYLAIIYTRTSYYYKLLESCPMADLQAKFVFSKLATHIYFVTSEKYFQT